MCGRVLPEWHLPEGTRNASEAELEAASSSCEVWSKWSGVLVAASVVFEFVIAWVHPSYSSSLERWGSFYADVGVFAGIIGEIFFGNKDAKIQTELRDRSNARVKAATIAAGEAHERAAMAELETEKLRAVFSWRRLSDEQIEKFLAVLADKPRLSIRIEYVGSDPESNSFAHEIGGLFKASGWKVGYTSASYAGTVTFGLCVPLYAPPNLDACGITRMAFAAASIEIRGGSAPTWFIGAGEGDAIPVGNPCAHLYVGPKATLRTETSDKKQETSKMSDEENKKMQEEWRARLQGNEPVMWSNVDAPLTITPEDDGSLLLDCRNLRLAGMEDTPGIARFRVSPDAVKALSGYFASLGKCDEDSQSGE